MPQAIRYSPTALPTSPAGTWPAKNWLNAQNDSQNAPYDVNAVAPNVLLLRNSHMPASSCASPPYASASPSTTGSPVPLTRFALKKLSTNVVSANAARPRGAGSAIVGASGGMMPARCSTVPSPFVVRRAVVASIELPPFREVIFGYPEREPHYTRPLGCPGQSGYRFGGRGYPCGAGFRGRIPHRRPTAGAG